MKIGIAGTMESSDALITVRPSEQLEVRVESTVYDYFGEQIEKTILDTLKELNVTNVSVLCQDKGALDFTIKARLITAIERMESKI